MFFVLPSCPPSGVKRDEDFIHICLYVTEYSRKHFMSSRIKQCENNDNHFLNFFFF